MATSIYAKVHQSFIAMGYSPIARFLKTWPEAWSDYCEALAPEHLHKRWGCVPTAGIALACGYGGLVAIDVDTGDKIILEAVLGALAHCRVGRFGSKGFALLCRYEGGPAKFKNIFTGEGKDKRPLVEIKGLGQNITIPPTIHKDTKQPYYWLDPESGEIISTPPALCDLPLITDTDLERLRDAMAPWASKPIEPRPQPRPGETPPSSTRYANYAKAGLERASKDLADAKDGRPTLLFQSVCALGWSVHHGFVSDREFASSFINACATNGLRAKIGLRAVEASIDSGLSKAKGDPMPTLPDRPLKNGSSKKPGANGHDASYEESIPAQDDGEPDDTKKPKKPKKQKQIVVEDDGLQIEDGKIKATFQNGLALLKRAGISFSYNEFTSRDCVAGLEGYGPHIGDRELDALFALLWNSGPYFRDRDIRAMIGNISNQDKFNPAGDYFAKCQSEWDGVERLSQWMETYLGAQDTPFNQAVARILMLATVRRVRQPGVKWDYLVILEGPQGLRKSLALETLCARKEWYSDDFRLHMDTVKLMELSAGKLILEISELSGMKKTEIEHVKALLSKHTDSGRLAWARSRSDQHRQFILVGTTNEEQYLRDESGNRRFLPVKVTAIDIAAIERDRDQLWGEAAYYEAKGESIWLEGELLEVAIQTQTSREVRDEREGVILDWLKKEFPSGSLFDPRVTLMNVWQGALCAPPHLQLDPVNQKMLIRCMKKIDWRKAECPHNQNFWRHKDDPHFKKK
jgi:Virulence-associated protein E/Bifunctional DNA primase/polymerase, N-terminal